MAQKAASRPARVRSQDKRASRPRKARAERPVLLATRSIKQTKALCGPACLKIVCLYYGRTVSLRRLARLCRTSLVSGTTGHNMVRAARSLGFHAAIMDYSTVSMLRRWLRRRVPVIVDWMSPGDANSRTRRMAVGHYSVACGMTRTALLLEDPAVGQRRRVAPKEFLKVWFDFVHAYPRTSQDLVIRRMIVVLPRVPVKEIGGAHQKTVQSAELAEAMDSSSAVFRHAKSKRHDASDTSRRKTGGVET